MLAVFCVIYFAVYLCVCMCIYFAACRLSCCSCSGLYNYLIFIVTEAKWWNNYVVQWLGSSSAASEGCMLLLQLISFIICIIYRYSLHSNSFTCQAWRTLQVFFKARMNSGLDILPVVHISSIFLPFSMDPQWSPGLQKNRILYWMGANQLSSLKNWLLKECREMHLKSNWCFPPLPPLW